MKNIKTILIFLFLISGFLGGALAEYFAPGQEFARSDLPIMFLSVTLIFFWYYFDSNDLNYKRPVFLNISIIAFSILAIPYYLYRTRGFKKGSLGLFLFMALAVIYSAFDIGGRYATNYLFNS